MEPAITTDIVIAHAQCPLKAYLLLFSPDTGEPHEYVQILEQQRCANQKRYLSRLQQTHADVQPYSLENLRKGSKVLINAHLQVDGFAADRGILTRVEGTSTFGKFSYEPSIFVGTHSISKEQQLELSFVGSVLERLQHTSPAAGRIIGMDGKSHTVKLDPLIPKLITILPMLQQWFDVPPNDPPPLILNKHCPYCQFREECRTKARDIDHLSLLGGMSKKEIEAQNKKGIFTITQLSYTYRPRKRRKRAKEQNTSRYYYSLKALAIRNDKIYVIQKPKIDVSQTHIFLDIEGIPDQNFYYLIGIVIIKNSSVQTFSFWADTICEEEGIWRKFLDVVRDNDNFSLFHYGSYETEFFERMRKKYPHTDIHLITKLKLNSINVVSLIYANIYFPTYSNSLKDIGAYLGTKWSSVNSTGLMSLVWRYKWEATRDEKFKQKLITYNIEDCLALKTVAQKLFKILDIDKNDGSKDSDIINEEDIKTGYAHHRFGHNEFLLDDLEFINKCSYFDYQREKVYFRNSKKMRRSSIKNINRAKNKYINKQVEIPTPHKCPQCNNNHLRQMNKKYKTVFDLKFFNYGLKRWVVKYSTQKVQCGSCNLIFEEKEFSQIKSKYGIGLRSWIVYQIVPLRQSYRKIQESIRVFYSYDLLDRSAIYRAKSEVAKYYNETYDKILSKLRRGHVIHADETTVNIKGVNSYVWVFTSFEEVLYVYHPTREGTILKEILAEFNGVLVSDFYHAYDSYKGPQQKCLIHLVRDMNDDLLKNPFDEEYKIFVKEFGSLLKPIIETIDKCGLRKCHLNKHQKDVNNFFDKYLSYKFTSEVSKGYQKRLINNQKKLFTFLDYDGVPWNNNNAEHAVKGFSTYRKTAIAGFTETGVKEYLTLLSIYETCKYKNIDFLQFLLSGETDLDKFEAHKHKRSQVMPQ